MQCNLCPATHLEISKWLEALEFSKFSCMFLNRNIFYSLNCNSSNSLHMSNLKEQVIKHSKLFRPITVNCSSYLKIFSLEFQKFFSTTRTFFFTVCQNNFDNKVPLSIELLFFNQSESKPAWHVILPIVFTISWHPLFSPLYLKLKKTPFF